MAKILPFILPAFLLLAACAGGKGHIVTYVALNMAAAEKAEGGEKKANYHRRYFHRGSKKPGGEKKHEG